MFLKRKNAVAAMIVLFICVAVYLNWSYTRGIGMNDTENVGTGKMLGEVALTNSKNDVKDTEGDKLTADNNKKSESEDDKTTNDEKKEDKKAEETGKVPDDYFTNARLDKQKARDSALNILKETTEKDSLSQEARDKATASIEALATSAVSESRIETLIKAKGFEDCIALINEEGVNVIVKAPEGGLTASDTTKIKDVVIGETKVKPSQIKIVEIK